MVRLFYLVMIINFLLSCLPIVPSCYAAAAKSELDWDYLTPTAKSRDLDTMSLHILNKISETNGRSVYRGFTITKAYGEITPSQQIWQEDSSAVGVGPIYLIRNEKLHSGKLTVSIDMSGGLILYDKEFPVGGEHYNFMWRIGPQFMYKFTPTSVVNIGYTFMHVSNGLHSEIHNPSYNAHGVTIGFATAL